MPVYTSLFFSFWLQQLCKSEPLATVYGWFRIFTECYKDLLSWWLAITDSVLSCSTWKMSCLSHAEVCKSLCCLKKSPEWGRLHCLVGFSYCFWIWWCKDCGLLKCSLECNLNTFGVSVFVSISLSSWSSSRRQHSTHRWNMSFYSSEGVTGWRERAGLHMHSIIFIRRQLGVVDHH